LTIFYHKKGKRANAPMANSEWRIAHCRLLSAIRSMPFAKWGELLA
jgi:hypothetical protein